MYSSRAGPGRSNTSPSMSSHQPQVRSALGTLKRSWSGNQQDLGNAAKRDISNSKPNGSISSVKGPESSQEIFYEWSPSPPPEAARQRSAAAAGPDKENAHGAEPAYKKVRNETTRSAAAPPPGQAGFVPASSLQKPSNFTPNPPTPSYAPTPSSTPAPHNAYNKHASSSYSVKTGSYNHSSSRAHPQSSREMDLARQFAFDRKNGSGSGSSSASGSGAWIQNMSGHSPAASTFSHSSQGYSKASAVEYNINSSSARSSSAPTMPWMKSAAQLREEKRINPNLSTIINASALPNMSGSSARSSPAIGAADASNRDVNKIFLSTEQRTVLQMVVDQGKNVFFTGSAGTGKSVLLREIIKDLKRKYAGKADSVAVTASTGIAACNIGGVTLHSFAGIGLGKEPVNQLVSKIKRNRKSSNRWLRTQVLIIDEVSMVEPSLLDKLEEIARVIKKKPGKPFGGIQLVITGDFFQLPPVNVSGGMTFAFEARCWNSVVENKVNLTQVFRQKDSTFVSMLNEMRFGRLSQKTIETFKTLERQPVYDADIVPTELFARREDVDSANMQRLKTLDTEGQSYSAVDGGTLDKVGRDRVLQSCMALPNLFLKKGAQVMLIKNIDETLVNGSIGKIIDFMDETEYGQSIETIEKEDKEERNKVVRVSQRKWPLVRFHLPNGATRDYLAKPESWKTELPDGEVQASRTQVPLILAWAISIHKSQGQTMPCCKINLNRVFEKGQAYVALSRATSLEGLQVFGFSAEKVMAHPKVIEWSKSLLALQPSDEVSA